MSCPLERYPGAGVIGPRLAPAGLRRRDEGPGFAERRDGLLNERSTLACIPGLLRLRDQVARLREPRHRVREDAALREHVDPILRITQRSLQARVLLPSRVSPVGEALPELARGHVDVLERVDRPQAVGDLLLLRLIEVEYEHGQPRAVEFRS